MTRAVGPFDVTLKPLPVDEDLEKQLVGRMSVEKSYHGDLEATGKGQMLTGGSSIRNSAAYVAIERVSGALNGRRGSFTLQHAGVMNRGAPSLVISVVPDSGTEQLEGLKGTMMINIDAGKHSYQLDYTLADRT